MAGLALFAGCEREVFTGKREARGVWMSRFEYSNEKTVGRPDSSQGLITSVFEKARAARLNMVFFQIRGSADAYYHSAIEPWAKSLTDTLGKDPGWDPLQFAIDEAHRLGLELHAWINTFPAWRGRQLPSETFPRHVLLAHPEWLVCDNQGKPMPLSSEYVNLSPGIPEARKHILSVVQEIVSKYDIDGIHFDYIRYPEDAVAKGYSHDSVSVVRFASAEGNPDKLEWNSWQREQIDQFVFDAYNLIVSIKPFVKVSAAVIGKYSGKGWTSYYSVYQDPLRWMQVGKIDFIVPMVYWDRGHPSHPFVPLITEWRDRVAYERDVFPGISTGLIKRFGIDEIVDEVHDVRRSGLPGVVFFSASGLDQAWKALEVTSFPYWANVPKMSWKDTLVPPPPFAVTATLSPQGVVLTWQSPPSSKTLNFDVYRSNAPAISQTDVFQIITITPRNVNSYLDRGALRLEGETLRYAVSAIDLAGNESPLSQTVQVEITPSPRASR